MRIPFNNLRDKGILDPVAALPVLWDSISADERDSVLHYMEHFGLCCPLPRGAAGGASWLVPSLLPEPPAAHSVDGNHELIIRFIHLSTNWSDLTPWDDDT